MNLFDCWLYGIVRGAAPILVPGPQTLANWLFVLLQGPTTFTKAGISDKLEH